MGSPRAHGEVRGDLSGAGAPLPLGGLGIGLSGLHSECLSPLILAEETLASFLKRQGYRLAVLLFLVKSS